MTTPTQRIKYLGFVIDSVTMTLSLPEEKVTKLQQTVRKAIREQLKGRVLSVRIAAKTIGFLVAALPATVYGKAHYRQLEFAKLRALHDNGFNFDAPFRWTHECLDDLTWWVQEERVFSAPFNNLPHTTVLTTDASLQGWGALWLGQSIFGAWEDDSRLIDELELRVVLQALETFPILGPGQRILLKCDNTTAVAYVNNMGGRIQRLDRVAKKIWRLLEQTQSFMTAMYIATDDNPADALTRGVTSRRRMLDTEVQLNPDIVRENFSRGPFRPQIDWFASDQNAQLPRFYTWKAMPFSSAEGVDAFMYSWNACPGYIFPPFVLIPRIIRKIRDERAKILLVHPRWPGALWYPDLEAITVMQQSICQSADVLRYPDHPDLRHPMTDLELQISWLDGASPTTPPGQR
jgi:hypothetical protein